MHTLSLHYKISFLHTKCLVKCSSEHLHINCFIECLYDCFNSIMAPKTSKGKHQGTPSSSFNRERFPDAQSAELQESTFKTRSVILERIVEQRGLLFTSFFNWISQCHLTILMDMKNDVFKDWVREFHCNMHEVYQNNFKTYVQRKTITVTPDSITELLEVQRPPNPYYLFPDLENVEMHKNDAATTLCGRVTEWNFEHLYTYDLTADYHLLNIFVCHNIKPHGHTLDLYYSQAYLLYAIKMSLHVDIPRTIFDSMLKVYEGLKRLALPFGVMICKLLIKYGFRTYDHEEPILHT